MVGGICHAFAHSRVAAYRGLAFAKHAGLACFAIHRGVPYGIVAVRAVCRFVEAFRCAWAAAERICGEHKKREEQETCQKFFRSQKYPSVGNSHSGKRYIILGMRVFARASKQGAGSLDMGAGMPGGAGRLIAR